jgi:hypothetical protein
LILSNEKYFKYNNCMAKIKANKFPERKKATVEEA